MFKQIKHTRFFVIPALLAVAVVFLTACASQPVAQAAAQTTEVPAAVAPVQATSTSESTTVPATTSSPADSAAGTVSFSKDIAPLLQESCVSCHGGEKTSKGLDVKTFASLMAGSQNGAVIVAGDAAKSKLVQSVQSGKMPKRGTKLTAEQVQLFTDWINAGAQNN